MASCCSYRSRRRPSARICAFSIRPTSLARPRNVLVESTVTHPQSHASSTWLSSSLSDPSAITRCRTLSALDNLPRPSAILPGIEAPARNISSTSDDCRRRLRPSHSFFAAPASSLARCHTIKSRKLRMGGCDSCMSIHALYRRSDPILHQQNAVRAKETHERRSTALISSQLPCDRFSLPACCSLLASRCSLKNGQPFDRNPNPFRPPSVLLTFYTSAVLRRLLLQHLGDPCRHKRPTCSKAPSIC
jgi:hypothetical protein